MNSTTPQLYQQLKKFVLRRVKNLQDAQDIVQDVFMRAQLKSHQLKEKEKFTAWMYTLTRNSITDFYRERKKIIERDLIPDSDDYNEFNHCISGCLGQQVAALPPVYREAFELADMKALPQKELAVRLGISYSGVKSRVQRARQMLKEKLEANYEIKTDGYGNVIACTRCGC